MSRVQILRAMVEQRLTAAVEEIFGLFERTIAEYEEEVSRSKQENDRQQKLLDAFLITEVRLHRADGPQLLVSKEDFPADQQQWRSPSLDQENPDPPHIKEEQVDPEQPHIKEEQADPEQPHIKEEQEDPEDPETPHIKVVQAGPEHLHIKEEQVDPDPPHIREEQVELWTSQEGEQLQDLEETDIPFTTVLVKSEDDEEEPQSSQLHQSQSEENRETEPLASTSTDQMETETGGDCGGSEPDSNLDPARDLQPNSDDQLLSSHCSEMKEPQSGLDTRKSSKKQEVVSDKGISRTGDRALGALSCFLCGKGFRNSGAVRRHMTVHTREKPFSCSVCGKRFTQRGTVVRHMTSHSGETPFSCPFCSKSFRQSNNLAIHVRIHTGEKPYCCSVCGKRFSQSGTSIRHMRSHTGEKPFCCSVCGKRFRQRQQLRIHKCVGESSSS